MASETRTSRSLLHRARAGEDLAWNEVVEQYAPLVYARCRHYSLQESDTADVIQEVFRTVSIHLARFELRTRPGSFRAWLRVVTQNKIHDLFRRRKKEVPGAGGTVAQLRLAAVAETNDADTTSSCVVRQSAEAAALENTLARIRGGFQETTWQAFWRTTVDGQPATEVAEELGISPGAARVAKFRVLRKLRHELGLTPDGR